MKESTLDTRINQALPLITPWVLADQLPLPDTTAAFVGHARNRIEGILAGKDPRMVAIVGPCSVHDPEALIEFTRQLKAASTALRDTLEIVVRVYFEKPRTVLGWKGLINDPDLDGSCRINQGLYRARSLLLEIAELGLPAASEFLDTTLGQYYAELVSFGAIGARTVESQVHRQLASGLSMPVGFKNGTTGDIRVAIDAIRSARHSHWFPSITHEGTPALLESRGNPHGYLILRGGRDSGPNYHAADVAQAASQLAQAGLEPGVIVDCSHGNCDGDYRRQAQVLSAICDQVEQGQAALRGVMIESHLEEGSQRLSQPGALDFGRSITDPCLALRDTVPLLEQLAAAVHRGRRLPAGSARYQR